MLLSIDPGSKGAAVIRRVDGEIVSNAKRRQLRSLPQVARIRTST